MHYIETSGGKLNGNQIILEPEDWSEEEWKTILKLFGMEEAERIVIADYTIEAYGKEKKYDQTEKLLLDKRTKEWADKHLAMDVRFSVIQCKKCGLWYRPSLGHECTGKQEVV